MEGGNRQWREALIHVSVNQQRAVLNPRKHETVCGYNLLINGKRMDRDTYLIVCSTETAVWLRGAAK